MPPWAPKTTKWQDGTVKTRRGLEHEADLRELEAEQLLQGAFAHAPSLPEAHLALAESTRGSTGCRGRCLDAQRAKAGAPQHHAGLPRHTPHGLSSLPISRATAP